MKCGSALYNYNSVNDCKKLLSDNSSAPEQDADRDSCALLCDYYKNQRKKQGFIGKLFDNLKNFLGLKSGSQNVERKLETYKLNSDDIKIEGEAIKVVNKYAKTQAKASSIARNVFAAMCAGAASFLFRKKLDKTYQKFLTSLAFGTVGGVALKYADAKSAKRKYSKKEVLNDAVQGGTSGLLNCTADLILLDFPQIKSAAVKKIFKTGFKIFAKAMIISSFAKTESIYDKNKRFEKNSNFKNDNFSKKPDNSDSNGDEIEYFDPRVLANKGK